MVKNVSFSFSFSHLHGNLYILSPNLNKTLSLFQQNFFRLHQRWRIETNPCVHCLANDWTWVKKECVLCKCVHFLLRFVSQYYIFLSYNNKRMSRLCYTFTYDIPNAFETAYKSFWIPMVGTGCISSPILFRCFQCKYI